MATLRIERVSRWYGNVVAVNDVTMAFSPGVTGLLGPNGAGKSTLINMMGGFLPPSSGSITLDGVPVWRNELIYRQIGLVPEREAMYDVVTGWEFVLANARLHSLPDPEGAARRALETVDLLEAQHRKIATYSKGMRQRAKLATALVHSPSVLLLDEPFNGLDPRQRLHLMDLLRSMASAGCCVIFSSHILEEVEELAERIEVMVSGRHAASGGFREIRRLMTERPHRYTVRSADDRALASAIIAERCASAVELVAGTGSRVAAGATAAASLQVQATDVGDFVHVLPRLASRHGIRLYEVSPADESLESVFSYLVTR
ncbi:MAG: ABC transporter ATP-binding protein [Sporichthyaceae bacterium]